MIDRPFMLDDDSFNLESSGIWELDRAPSQDPVKEGTPVDETPELVTHAPRPRTAKRELLETEFPDVD